MSVKRIDNIERRDTGLTQSPAAGHSVSGAASSAVRQQNPLQIERNSLILEDWADSIPWEGKLAACVLHELLTSKQDRLQEVGRRILGHFEGAISETEGLTSESDLWAREVLFLTRELQMVSR